MIPFTIKEEEFQYQLPPREELIGYKRDVDKVVPVFQRKLKMGQYEIEVNYPLFCNIIVRIDQRKDYYKYYHSTDDKIMRMSRGKEIALLAYWIVKYKPFRVKGMTAEEDFYCAYRCSFNEIFAAMSIASFIREEMGSQSAESSFFTDAKMKTMLYDFFNRDISKEAMIMYVESFISEKTA